MEKPVRIIRTGSFLITIECKLQFIAPSTNDVILSEHSVAILKYCDCRWQSHKSTRESKDLRTDLTLNVTKVRRSLDSISFRSG